MTSIGLLVRVERGDGVEGDLYLVLPGGGGLVVAGARQGEGHGGAGCAPASGRTGGWAAALGWAVGLGRAGGAWLGGWAWKAQGGEVDTGLGSLKCSVSFIDITRADVNSRLVSRDCRRWACVPCPVWM